MANPQNSSHGRDAGGHTPTGSGRGYTHVSSQLHGAAQDVSELLDLLTAGVVADDSTAAGIVVAGSVADDDAVEPGGRRQGRGDRGDSR
jgi:hypothetical protein